MPGLLGKKVGMTRVIQENGEVIPVTVISVPDATVTQVKTVEKDGYQAAVLGIDPLKKPTKTKKFLTMKEFRFETLPEKGSVIGLSLLQDVKEVSISAVSKGRGFTGVVKRHHFRGGGGSHGHAGRAKNSGARLTGWVGAREKPGRIKKVKRFPGRHGNALTTRHHVPVIQVDNENKLLALKVPIPGAPGNTVHILF